MNQTDSAALVRRYFEAWMAADRAAMESLLSEGFRFNSPRDEWIDRATWFATCWPFAGTFNKFDMTCLVASGRIVYVSYDAETAEGGAIHNTELMEFEGEKLRSVDVFFGRGSS